MKIKGVVMLDLLFFGSKFTKRQRYEIFPQVLLSFYQDENKTCRDVGFTIFGSKFTKRQRNEIFLQVLLSFYQDENKKVS